MSTEFEEIVIENFGTIEHIKLVLNTPGMILITGLNKDAPKAISNGAGKSLLLDAICWCLWGKTVRGLTADDVVRLRVGQDCCVSLKIKDTKTSYIVTRHRKDTRIDKPNDLKLFINGVEKGKKLKNLQEIIDNIIGFDFDTFCAMMPGAGVSAASLTDIKIKELLEKLLQTEQLSFAHGEARDRLKALDVNLTTQNTTLVDIQEQLAALEKEVSQLRNLEQSFVTTKVAAIASRQQRIVEYERDIAACEAETQKASELQNSLNQFRHEIMMLQKQITAIEKPSKARVKLFEAEIQNHEQTIRLIEHDRATRQTKIQSFSKLGSTCPTCESPITAEHIQACSDALNAQTRAEENNYTYAKSRRTELRRALNDEVHLTASQIVELQGTIDIKASAVTELQRALDQCHTQVKIKTRLESDLLRERDGLCKAASEEHNFKEIFVAKAMKVHELVQVLCQCLTIKRQLEQEHKLCSFWVDGFSPAGLRSYMLDYVTPILNDRAAYYADVLTGGEMKVIFTTKTALKGGGEKDKFQIMVEQKHGGNRYEGTSKGEKARADLVIAMALGDLATFRTAKQLPWRFLDEPFESIDDAGNEAVMQLLNDQKSRYKTVFVVTHKPAFKKLFNQRITVVKENGVSRLEHD